MVDLAGIRDDLKQLPMVHEVTVRRAWPDRLMVFITEQVPVLRLGEDAYLNPYAGCPGRTDGVGKGQDRGAGSRDRQGACVVEDRKSVV